MKQGRKYDIIRIYISCLYGKGLKMEFKSIEKKDGGKFLHRYDLHYVDPLGAERCYEMVSRRDDIEGFDQLVNHPADAVVMIVTDRENEHMALIHEYRMELGQKIYGCPGGLIDPGETPEMCARRELKEETGLDLVEIREILPAAACTVGIGDERTICIFVTAEGEFHPDRATGEEIEARWYTRSEILERQKTALFGSWALAFSWMWATGRL